MIDRKEFAEELMLRESVRKAINIILERKMKKQLVEQKQELELRHLIRNLIDEAKNIAIYPTTGQNELNIFLLQSGFKEKLETSYNKLTTAYEQRESYMKHMIAAVTKYLGQLDSLASPEGAIDIEEKVDIEVSDEPPEIMGDPLQGEKEKTTLEPAAPTKAEFMIKGEDPTGGVNAFEDFDELTTILRDAYARIPLPSDREEFKRELPVQMQMYADRWELAKPDEPKKPPEAIAEPEAEVTPAAEPAQTVPDLSTLSGRKEDSSSIFEDIVDLVGIDIDDLVENILK